MKNFLSFFLEVVKIVVISLAIVIPIRYFVFQPFFVKGMSMEPTFENGEYLIIDELSPRFKGYQRGEVVVFRFPQDPSQFYIKRIIGLPGEKIEVRNGEVRIFNDDNPLGFTLDEPYLPNSGETIGNLEMTLDKNEYFVLGDNRPASSDSRRWGILPQRNISGVVLLRAWPFDKFQFMADPTY